eukprot:PhM_4_TR8391/c2_g2_i10/m.62593
MLCMTSLPTKTTSISPSFDFHKNHQHNAITNNNADTCCPPTTTVDTHHHFGDMLDTSRSLSGCLPHNDGSMLNVDGSATPSTMPSPGTSLQPVSPVPMTLEERFEYKTIGNYKIGRVLGNGEFCEVRLALDTRTDRLVAVKFIPFAALEIGRLTLDQLDLEVDAIEACGNASAHAVRMLDFLKSGRYYYLVMEYCPGGTLFSYLQSQKLRRSQQGSKAPVFPATVARGLFRQVLEAVRDCHRAGYAHRDVKPENFLVQDDAVADGVVPTLKLSDYGMAWPLAKAAEAPLCCGTPHYLDPNLLDVTDAAALTPESLRASDMWSCGVVLYIVLSGGRMPFYGTSVEAVLASVKEGAFDAAPVLAAYDDVALSLLQGLLCVNVSARLSVEEALRHPWFTAEV